MSKRLMWWFIFLSFAAIMVFIAALFVTPEFTKYCTRDLLMCIEDGSYSSSLWHRLSQTFLCTYHNVVCVLGGLFV